VKKSTEERIQEVLYEVGYLRLINAIADLAVKAGHKRTAQMLFRTTENLSYFSDLPVEKR